MATTPTSPAHGESSSIRRQAHAELRVGSALGQPMVTVKGELDLASAEIVRKTLARAVPDSRDLTLDLSGVTFIDLAGLNAVVDGTRQLAGAGVTVVVVGMSRPVIRLIEVLERVGFEVDLPVAR